MNHKTLTIAFLIILTSSIVLGVAPNIAHATTHTVHVAIGSGQGSNPPFTYIIDNGQETEFQGGDLQVDDGSNLTLHAYPAQNYLFQDWHKDGFFYSDSNIITVQIFGDYYFDAYFYAPTPPPSTPTPEPTPSPSPTPGPGGPIETGSTGYWDIAEYPFYSVNLNDTWRYNIQGRANYTFGHVGEFSNSTGIQLDFQINKLLGDRYEWWWTSGVKYFYVGVQLTDGTNSIYALIYLAHEQGIIAQTGQIKFGTTQQKLIQYGNFGDAQLSRDVNFSNAVVGMQMIDKGDGWDVNYCWFTQYNVSLGRWIGERVFDFNKANAYTEHFNTELNGNLTLNLYVMHEGNGKASVTFADSYTKENNMVPYTTSENITETQRSWIEQVYDFLVGSFSFFAQLLQMLMGAVVQITPYLPFIGILYIIDLAATSFQRGSLQPIGAAFQWVYDLLVKTYDALIHFGQYIWDMITFWT